MHIYIWTDGACSGNPGPGGYAYIAKTKEKVLIKCAGHRDNTTNNAMELTAIVKAIKFAVNYEVAKRERVTERKITLYSDSAYCLNAINQKWIYNWKNNEWKTKDKKPVKNLELWQELFSMLENEKCTFEFIKVKGHAGNKYNEMVDKIAKKAMKKPLEGIEACPSKG